MWCTRMLQLYLQLEVSVLGMLHSHSYTNRLQGMMLMLADITRSTKQELKQLQLICSISIPESEQKILQLKDNRSDVLHANRIGHIESYVMVGLLDVESASSARSIWLLKSGCWHGILQEKQLQS